MEDMEGSDSIRNEVVECEQLVIDIPQDLPPADWPECCIYKVPKLLRKVNEEAYTPKLVSIGPFHHGREEFRDMEMHKLRYFKDFFQRRTLIKKSQKDLASIIEAKEEKIRHCYSEDCRLIGSTDFVKMILLDAIFIIELLLKAGSSEEAMRKGKKDYIQRQPWLENIIFSDLILLENQIPFFVLEDLYMSAFNESSSLSHQQEGQQIKEHQGDLNKEDTPFLKLSRRFFSNIFDIDEQKESNIGGEVKHFTDLLRYLFCSPKLKPAAISLQNLCSATELDEAGLKFKRVEKRRLLDITFPENKWLEYCPCFNLSWLLACLPCLKCFPCSEAMERFLEVPCFKVEDRTEALFRNLMALEQCHYPFQTYICNYVWLLDDLINTDQDVALLVERKVIANRMGSNATVATLINNLCLEIVVNGSCYSALAQEIHVYRDNPWNRNMASMKSVYFRDFWRGTATVVGLIVLTFTFWDFLKPYVKKNHKKN